jgi:DNA-directed RNA polymerase subunit F
MIKETNSLSMAESSEYLEKGTDALVFIKKFTKMKPEKAKELRKKLQDLENIKISDKHISKVIDVLPEKAEEVNKIFSDVGLDEDETRKILEIVKEYR